MEERKQPSWGRLEKRYGGEPRPRKLLALDGGGIRGILTLQVLIRMEDILKEQSGQGEKFRLCNFFDYIGGTSTGAIIAAGLARGMSARELSAFYMKTGPAMFDKSFILFRLRHLYESKPLAKELQKTFGKDTNLFPEHLKCLLLVVTRNVSTDSPWPISSNPFAAYNLPHRGDCNLCIPLWQLVRASTAAPVYFAPEVLQWDKKDPSKTFVFEDGGLTPYNNPAFLLARMATHSAYRLNWQTGEDKLLVMSVGTGSAPKEDAEVYSSGKSAFTNLANFPSALMYGAQVDQDINCRTVGRCVHGARIDRELWDLIPRRGDVREGEVIPLSEDQGRQFLYARYNAELTARWLSERGLGDVDASKVAQLDSVEHINGLIRVGQKLAEEVKLEHFALDRFGHFEPPLE
ncbi:MAG TPA: patatin-like phospholipase family protein [Pyrinomonadaceae bacterium]|nr:patatin-like phospholipase family protein [Pyrinomonadaceae bacterium]